MLGICSAGYMEKQDLRVIDQIIQKDYKNMQGRSAVMDCVARDSEGKQFDVESSRIMKARVKRAVIIVA